MGPTRDTQLILIFLFTILGRLNDGWVAYVMYAFAAYYLVRLILTLVREDK